VVSFKVRIDKEAYELLATAAERYNVSMSYLCSRLIKEKLADFVMNDLQKEPKVEKLWFIRINDLKEEVESLKLRINMIIEQLGKTSEKITDLYQRVSKLELQCQRG